MARVQYRGKRWRDARDAVLERDGWICQLCGQPIDRFARPGTDRAGTADHVRPVSLGGAWWDLANLRAAHISCNRSRGNRVEPPRYPVRPPW